MASTDATPVPIKNQAYRVTFPILDADGDLVTGATGLDSEVSKDAGTFADCGSEATEIATNSGMYYLDLTNTEMNADCVAIIVKTSTSGAKTVTIVLYPVESGDIPVNVTKFGGTTVTGGDLNAKIDTIDDFVDTEVAAIKAKTDLIPGTVDGKTFIQGWTLAMAVLLGKASGMGTATGIFRAVDDSKDRVTATQDASGNRAALTLDAS